MFQELGERLDDWLHGMNLRRLRLMRRLGLLPRPTRAQVEATAAWDRAVAHLPIRDRLPLYGSFVDLTSSFGPQTGKAVSFPKYANLLSATETLEREASD